MDRFEVEVELEAGATLDLVLGEPAADPIRVHGQLRQAGRHALLRVQRKGRLGRSISTASDERGTYALIVDGPGWYTFTVGFDQSSLVSLERQIPDVESYELNLELPSGRLEGRVTAVNGAPWSGVVRLERERSSEPRLDLPLPRSTTSTRDGRFSFSNLGAGEYAAYVNGRRARGGIALAPGQALEGLELELPVDSD